MCGICGWLSLDGSPIDEATVRGMTRALSHRGPDGEGYDARGSVAFGHRRLSIIDPEGGQQPFVTEDGRISLTYNGEIYNFPTLMSELVKRGHRFRTRCD